MANVIGHFRTITKHRHKVIKHCFKAGIGWQGLRHDLSKYSPTEFFNGVKYYDGTRSPTSLNVLTEGIQRLGFITRAEISTILNIGMTIIRKFASTLPLKCRLIML